MVILGKRPHIPHGSACVPNGSILLSKCQLNTNMSLTDIVSDAIHHVLQQSSNHNSAGGKTPSQDYVCTTSTMTICIAILQLFSACGARGKKCGVGKQQVRLGLLFRPKPRRGPTTKGAESKTLRNHRLSSLDQPVDLSSSSLGTRAIIFAF